MNQFSRMNKKLDEGWKLTTLNCDCKTSFLIKVETKELYCPRCDKISKQQFIIDQEEDDEEEQDQNDYPQSYLGVDKFETVKSDAASKKMGELLIQGWAMLEQTCLKCCFPIMKSKKGVKLCVYCNEEIQEPSKDKKEPSKEKQEPQNLIEACKDQKQIIPQINQQQQQVSPQQQTPQQQTPQQQTPQQQTLQQQVTPQQPIQTTSNVNQQQITPQPQNLSQFSTILLKQFHLQLEFLSKQLQQCNQKAIVQTVGSLLKTYHEISFLQVDQDKISQVEQDFDTYLSYLLKNSEIESYSKIMQLFISLVKTIKQK